jgi:hypothetical protein
VKAGKRITIGTKVFESRMPAIDHRPIRERLVVRKLSPGFRDSELPYVINWDSIASDRRTFLVMSDPFSTYTSEVSAFLRR